MATKKYKSTRQIPTSKDFNKKTINDKLYGFFQINSYLGLDEDDQPVRFIYRRNFTNEGLADVLGISTMQAKRQVKVLKVAGFIADGKVWNKEKTTLHRAFVLTEYEKEIQYIQFDTLKKLVALTNKNVIKVYAHLLGWYGLKQNTGSNFIFTKKQLILYCFGVKSTTNQADYEAINIILEGLVLLGLIEYKYIVCDSPEGHYHTRMELTKVNKTVKEVSIEKSSISA